MLVNYLVHIHIGLLVNYPIHRHTHRHTQTHIHTTHNILIYRLIPHYSLIYPRSNSLIHSFTNSISLLCSFTCLFICALSALSLSSVFIYPPIQTRIHF